MSGALFYIQPRDMRVRPCRPDTSRHYAAAAMGRQQQPPARSFAGSSNRSPFVDYGPDSRRRPETGNSAQISAHDI
jgi:hypothetical protein